MKLLILVAISIWLVGCEAPSRKTVRMSVPNCKEVGDRKNLSDFIIKCSEAANPKSDEEGEDLVAQCEKTGNRVWCPEEHLCQTVTDPGGFFGGLEFSDWSDCAEIKK